MSGGHHPRRAVQHPAEVIAVAQLCFAGRVPSAPATRVPSCSSTQATGCVPPSRHRARSVDAAVAAQKALELPVRMGIATGEADLREGDYFGGVLNRAARMMAAGHGGQILLADSTAVLLSGVDLQDLGRGDCETYRRRSGCSRFAHPG